MKTLPVRLLLLFALLTLVSSSVGPPGYAESDESLIFMSKAQAEERKRKLKELMIERGQLQLKIEKLEEALAEHKTQLTSLKKHTAVLAEAFKFIRAHATILWTSKTGSRLAGLLIDAAPEEVSLMTPKGKQQTIRYDLFAETDQKMLEYFRAGEEAQADVGILLPTEPGEVIGAGRIERILIPAE